jgi:hypothetical protein
MSAQAWSKRGLSDKEARAGLALIGAAALASIGLWRTVRR